MDTQSETLRISDHRIEIRIRVFRGKEYDHFVCYSPSLNVSGYGKTKKEANDSFDHNMDVFVHDLMKLSVKKRSAYLISLGWEKDKNKNKNYSHSYIDEDGVLRELELEDATIDDKVFAA